MKYIFAIILFLTSGSMAHAAYPPNPPTPIGNCFSYTANPLQGYVCITNGNLNGWFPLSGDVTLNSAQCNTANTSGCGKATVQGFSGEEINSQYLADNCPGMRNDGVHDDATPLNACIATMPAYSTMNLDPSKPYLFLTHQTPGYANCNLVFGKSGQFLEGHGANVSLGGTEVSPSTGSAPFCFVDTTYNFTPSGTDTPGNQPAYPIQNTTANTTRLTTVTASDAGNFAAGNDIYIDGPNGQNTRGWNEVDTANASTGVITFKYPFVKVYNSSPRIVNVKNGVSFDMGIEHVNFTSGGSANTFFVFTGGVVRFRENYNNIFNLNSVVNFSNFMQLGEYKYNKVQATGCNTDVVLSIGQGESEMNIGDHNNISVSGDGCSGETIDVEAAGEGAENDKFTNETVALNGGANASTAMFVRGAYNTTIDGNTCTAQVGTCFNDANTVSHAVYRNGHDSCAANNCIVPDDQGGDADVVTGNFINEFASTGLCAYLEGPTTFTGNTCINSSSGGGSGVRIAAGGDNSTVVSNIIECTGTCANGLFIEDPGSPSTAPLVLGPNAISGFTTSVLFNGSANANLPNKQVYPINPGGDAFNDQGVIASAGTLSCNYTGFNVCGASVGGGNFTIADPSGIVQNQEYQIFIYAITGNVTAGWGANWRYTDYGNTGALANAPNWNLLSGTTGVVNFHENGTFDIIDSYNKIDAQRASIQVATIQQLTATATEFMPPVLFGNLGTANLGQQYICTNCKNSVDDAVTVGAVCATGGHGALAIGINSTWRCY